MGRSKELTIKQENFCQYYVDTEGNASEAYRMAYDATKMKPETIWSNACVLTKNNKVSARIAEIRKERAELSRVKRETVEKVLMDIVTSDPKDLYIIDDVTGKVKTKSPHQLPKRTRNAIKKIKSESRGGVARMEYELNGKTEAARLLGAWNGWEADKHIDVTSDGKGIGEMRIGFGEDEE